MVYEYDGSGAMLASYVLGGTQLISQSRGGTTNYFLQDGQNSTRALTNNAGTVTDTYSYTAFGELFAQTGTTTNNYLYTGQQFDSLTGLYSLRARYYNPAQGRFLSQDTYPVNFGNPVELNRYVYTANSPVNLTDPSGNVATFDTGLINLLIAVKNVAKATIVGASIVAVAALAVSVLLAPVGIPGVSNPPVTAVPVPVPTSWEEVERMPILWQRPTTTPKPGPTQQPSPKPGETNPPPPIPTQTRTPEPIYIYRKGPDKARTVRLSGDGTWKTGFSFATTPYPEGSIKFRVDVLEANGYVVVFDGGKDPEQLPFFGGGPYFPMPVMLPFNHVTVYYNNKEYWDKWYYDEQENTGKPIVSYQTQAFYELRER